MIGGLWAIAATNGRAPGATGPASRVGPHLPTLGRAIALREALQEVLADGDLPSIVDGWARRTAPDSNPLANSPYPQRTLHGILAYLQTRLTNAAIEAINSLLQMASASLAVSQLHTCSLLISRPVSQPSSPHPYRNVEDEKICSIKGTPSPQRRCRRSGNGWKCILT